MPKLKCPCGFVHNLASIPDEGWITVEDRLYEKVIDAEIRRNEISGGSKLPDDDHPRITEYDEMTSIVVKSMGCLYECPECGRLMWQRSSDDVFRVFVPDDSA